MKPHTQDGLLSQARSAPPSIRGLTINNKHLMKPILGVDIAKDKFDCCLLLGEQKLSHQFTNSARGFKQLMRWVTQAGAEPGQLFVCLEATGLYGEKLLRWLFDQGVAVSKVNPARIKYYAKSRLARNKTDRLDAFIIAQFCRSEAPRPWKPLPPEQEKLRGLTRLLSARKEQLGQERRRAAMLPEFLRAHLRGMLRSFQRQIDQLQEQIDALIESTPELKRKKELLRSIPSVGPVTAQTVLAELPPEIQNARAAAAYAGLTPEREDSGEKTGRGRMSKTGNPHLRQALYMPAVSGRRSNHRLQECAQRLEKNGKPKMVVIGACMHLLMRLCFGVLRRGEPFQENWRTLKKAA
jgi:transposase